METNFAIILKQHHLSSTAVRLAVLSALHEHPHADANQVFQLVQGKIATTSLQAVYNNLNQLVASGIIREIKPKGHVSLYETRIGDNHHHLVCRNCHSVVDTDCQTSAPCISAVDGKGFIIDEAEITFWGLCPQCQLTTGQATKAIGAVGP